MATSEPTPKLPRSTRAALWFGIYFGAQLPLLKYAAGFYFFPFGLLALARPTTSAASGAIPGWFMTACIAAYAIYLVHFIIAISVPSTRAFRYLMIALVVIVVLNLSGCVSMLQGLKNIN